MIFRRLMLALQIILIIAKLASLINWSWWWVWSPSLFMLALNVLLGVLIFVIVGVKK